jgi:hypothetical protein
MLEPQPFLADLVRLSPHKEKAIAQSHSDCEATTLFSSFEEISTESRLPEYIQPQSFCNAGLHLPSTYRPQLTPTSDRVWQLTLTKPHSNSPVYLSRRPIRCLQVEKLAILVVGGLSDAGNEDICSVLAGYAVLLPGVFDQPFIAFLDWMEDHGRRGPPVLLSTRVVELFGF